MKTDGKLLEYKTPMKADKVLSDFDNHAISDSLPAVKLNHVLPLPGPEPATKKVKFADQEADREGIEVVRIKIIISKQELEALLSKDQVSVDDMVHHLHQNQKSSNEEAGCRGWKPMLDSIPELD
ncbi:unnamed protein product [Cuscuta campestris]|uniref:Uncharacterized protein n=1 Tax=Cuscuta campestris TaxID=132261 RepID=A0A484LDA2_9ASTE|nr:unnamed protein product [Cuscuta campestris]